MSCSLGMCMGNQTLKGRQLPDSEICLCCRFENVTCAVPGSRFNDSHWGNTALADGRQAGHGRPLASSGPGPDARKADMVRAVFSVQTYAYICIYPIALAETGQCYIAVILMMLCVPNVRHLMDGCILQMEDGAQYKKYENGVFHPEHVQDSARQPLPGQVGHCDYSPECSTEGSDQVCRHIWSPPHNRLSTQHALVVMRAYSIVQAVLNRLRGGTFHCSMSICPADARAITAATEDAAVERAATPLLREPPACEHCGQCHWAGQDGRACGRAWPLR